MSKVCPECGNTGSDRKKFCAKCGEKLEYMPCCNWHFWSQEEIWPYMKHCPKCGRSRDKALNTSPPPLRTRINNWLSGILKKKVSEN